MATEFDKLVRAVDAVKEAGIVVQVGTQLRSLPSIVGCPRPLQDRHLRPTFTRRGMPQRREALLVPLPQAGCEAGGRGLAGVSHGPPDAPVPCRSLFRLVRLLRVLARPDSRLRQPLHRHDALHHRREISGVVRLPRRHLHVEGRTPVHRAGLRSGDVDLPRRFPRQHLEQSRPGLRQHAQVLRRQRRAQGGQLDRPRPSAPRVPRAATAPSVARNRSRPSSIPTISSTGSNASAKTASPMPRSKPVTSTPSPSSWR